MLLDGIGTELVLNRERNMRYTKSKQVLHRKNISILSDLKVSPLTCKCVLYRPEDNAKGDTMELNFESLVTQKNTNT